ncbi:MAG: hypothetical protein IIA54_09290, partial [Chloroflexi bacterium]|nr:hypothetical protein [Chloroflexota bacterium]
MTLQRTAAARGQNSGGAADGGHDSLELQIHERLLSDLDVRQMDQLPEQERRDQVTAAATAVLQELAPGIAGVVREQIVINVVNDTVGLGPLQPLLDNPDISEIMIVSPDR